MWVGRRCAEALATLICVAHLWISAQWQSCRGTWNPSILALACYVLLMVIVFIRHQELIQNADDARATEVVFIHDDRSYGTDNLWTDELGEYQGIQDVQSAAMFWDGYQHQSLFIFYKKYTLKKRIKRANKR